MTDMRFWTLFLFPVLLHSSLEADTVAEDIGLHQLERLVELLTSKECENLLLDLTHPEENILRRLEHLLPENNQLDLKPRVSKRDISSVEDREAKCRTALTAWLLENGEQIYNDRLTRALQHIGRTDIALELGKNINQDQILSLQHNLDDLHQRASKVKFPSARLTTVHKQNVEQRRPGRKVRLLTGRDLDLVVQWTPVPVYHKGLMVGLRMLLYGMLLGFGGTFIVGTLVFLSVIYFFHRNQKRRLPLVAGRSGVAECDVSNQSLRCHI